MPVSRGAYDMNPRRHFSHAVTRTANTIRTRYILRAWANVSANSGPQRESAPKHTRSANPGSTKPAHLTHRLPTRKK